MMTDRKRRIIWLLWTQLLVGSHAPVHDPYMYEQQHFVSVGYKKHEIYNMKLKRSAYWGDLDRVGGIADMIKIYVLCIFMKFLKNKNFKIWMISCTFKTHVLKAVC